MCGSKDPLESERKKRDTSSASMLQIHRVPTPCPSQTHVGPKESSPGWAAGRQRRMGCRSPAKPGLIPVSPATRGPHAISDAQGSRKPSWHRSSLSHSPLAPTQAFLGRARPILQRELDLARRVTATRPQARSHSQQEQRHPTKGNQGKTRQELTIGTSSELATKPDLQMPRPRLEEVQPHQG